MNGSDANQRIADDLGRKISATLEENLLRELNIAKIVLPATDLIPMLMNIAHGVSMGIILAGMQMMNDDTEASTFFDLMRAEFDRKVGHSKEGALLVLAMIKAGKTDEARAMLSARR